jgi:hypothetical protein
MLPQANNVCTWYYGHVSPVIDALAVIYVSDSPYEFLNSLGRTQTTDFWILWFFFALLGEKEPIREENSMLPQAIITFV